MRNADAETVLDVLRERGRRGLPLEGIYRQLFNPQLCCWPTGASTPTRSDDARSDAETADGMTLAKIERIIDAVRHERYPFKPVKRRYIPKKDGKQRPLGLPSWSDKLLGEVIRLLLEAYYEPQFSDRSHGYRPGRGCHTALGEVARTWTGTSWFIEGDISQCFDRLDSRVMLETLGEKIHDNRLLQVGRSDAGCRVLGGLGVERHAQRRAAGRGSLPVPVQHLPGSAGQVRRDGPDFRDMTEGCSGGTILSTRGCNTRSLKLAYRGAHAAVRALRRQQRGLSPSHGSPRSWLQAAAVHAIRR